MKINLEPPVPTVGSTTYTVLGLRLPVCELIVVPFKTSAYSTDPSEDFRLCLREVFLELAFDENGLHDDSFLYVCTLNDRGSIVSRVEELGQGDDGLEYQPDFELNHPSNGHPSMGPSIGAIGFETYTVILVRLEREESLTGIISARSPREASELGMQYAEQNCGKTSDVQFVAVVSPDGTIEITAENWVDE